MEGGLLSLKWNDHSRTFFDMLSTIRRKESYCDVTLVSEGRFYPVHKLVLSTCSDFFDHLFKKTDCKHPVVIVANVSYKDLEALLNYMYLGEVNVLQTELGNLMKAAEVLRIKGLAEPTKPQSKDIKDSQSKDIKEPSDSNAKRKRYEEAGNPPSKRLSPHVLDHLDTSEPIRPRVSSDPLALKQRNSEVSTDSPSQNEERNQEVDDKARSPEVKVEEVLIKDESEGWYEGEEGIDSLQFDEPDTSLAYQTMDYSGSCLPWKLPTTQPHPLEGHLSQGMPGASGMQGMLDFGSRSSLVQLEKYRVYEATKRTRNFVENWRTEFPWVNYDAEKKQMTCNTCVQYCQEEDKSRFISGNTNFKRLALVRHGVSLVHQRCEARLQAALASYSSPLIMGFSVDKCEVESQD